MHKTNPTPKKQHKPVYRLTKKLKKGLEINKDVYFLADVELAEKNTSKTLR